MKKLALTLTAIILATQVYAADFRQLARNTAGYISEHGMLQKISDGSRESDAYGRVDDFRVIYRLTDRKPYGRFNDNDNLRMLFMNDQGIIKVIDDVAADGSPDWSAGFGSFEEMNEAYQGALKEFDKRANGYGLLAQK